MGTVRAPRVLPLLLLLLPVVSSGAGAQANGAQANGADTARASARGGQTAIAHGIARAVQVGYDNDLLSLRGKGKPPDFDYTSGARVSAFHASAPRWLRAMTGRTGRCDIEQDLQAGCVASGFGVNHRIYTPRENSLEPVPGQRPYAGWLYGSLDMSLVRDGWSRSFGVDAGVTGPLSFAERVQNRLHTMLHTRRQLGWKNQLPNAPGIVLRYDEGRRFEHAARRAISAADVHWSAAAGNMVNAVSVGSDISIGLRGTRPWSPAEPRVSHPARAYFTMGYQQDLVMHSVLIDGRGAVPGATRLPWVGQLEAGMGYRHRLFDVAYRHTVRGREYDSQPSRHAYGSVTISTPWF
jgi:lipid A 3-O-deacylase